MGKMPSGNTPVKQKASALWAHLCPERELSLTLLSSGVGGRGFFDAKTRKTEKEHVCETERPQPEVSSEGAFRRKGALRRTAEEEGPEGDGETQGNPIRPCQNLSVVSLSACWFLILFFRRCQELPEAKILGLFLCIPSKA